MARRWTPQRMVMLRRIRVAACALIVTAVSVGMFLFTARKTVAITVDGETTTVTTYAMSAQRLLESQGITVKTHDLVESSAGGDRLTDRSVVTVRSAYQTTITIDGQKVPFWTTATSAEQLLSFFEQNEAAAAKVTVNIDNVYNRLTGGLVINECGPVTVIADGKRSQAPNGKLPAASILDSKGITVGKNDRISVEKDGDETILRVQRITHQQETRTIAVPHGTQTILDPALEPGQTEIRQQGEDGATRQVFDVTYVDGVAESETLVSSTTEKIAIDTIVAVGPEKTQSDGSGSDTSDSGDADTSGDAANDSTSGNGTANDGKSESSQDSTDSAGSDSKQDAGDTNGGATGNSGTSSGSTSGGTSNNSGSGSGNNSGTSGKNDANDSTDSGTSGNTQGSTAGDSASGNGSGQHSGGTGNGGSGSNSGGGSGNDDSGNSNGNSSGSGTTGNGSNGNSDGSAGSGNSGNSNNSNNTGSGSDNSGSNNTGSGNSSSNSSGSSGSSNSSGNSNNSSGNSNSNSSNSGSSTDSESTARLWRPTVAQAQTYAAGAAAQRGWTGDEWTALVKLWTRESSWRWNAENSWTHAYGIPQALPGNKMAAFGSDWKNDAAVQIDWGLYYIAQRYGTPAKAWKYFQEVGWY
ncbi:DUF348 domain-containing protein [Bifidobacterium sp. 81T8]|nr:DUF348 domain-containing protein [Bifidobacterium simiiventris]